MKMLQFIHNQKGVALITTYLVGAIALVFSIAAYQGALSQSRNFQRDGYRVSSYEAAESGIQAAMQQIGVNSYTGSINSSTIASTAVSSTYGASAGSYSVVISYGNADWVVVTATGTSGSTTTVLEGTIFLQSTLSKYAVFITAATTGGANLTLGASDGVNARGVAEDPTKRGQYYYSSGYTFGGTNINIYGDFNVEGALNGFSSGTTQIYGDAYVGNYTENSSGVTSSGLTNANRINISDGFSADDEDRNGNGSITSADYPDLHDLNATGLNDANKTQTLPTVDTAWYAANNSVTAFNTSGNRYLIFADNGTSANTVVKHVTSTQFASYLSTGTFSGSPTATYSLPNKAVVYNNGSVYVAGSITGRVAVVASNDIYFDGSVSYNGNARYASSANAAAFIASDQVFLRGDTLNLSGILYAQNNGAHACAFEAGYNTSGAADASKAYLRFYGNTLMTGSLNTSVYSDRAWIWDSNLMKYRPPGVPVEPELRMVREVVSD